MPTFQPYWGKPAVRNDRGGSRRRRHHSKPGPRLDPTRLGGEGGNTLAYPAKGRAALKGCRWVSLHSPPPTLRPYVAVCKFRGRCRFGSADRAIVFAGRE